MKILILGTGPAQIDAIQYCKEYGNQVFACSNRVDNYVHNYLDGFELADIKDIGAVNKFAVKSNADIIYSIGSDFGNFTSCHVSESLGLPHFNRLSELIILQNKFLMREMLGLNNSLNPKYKLIKSIDDIKGWNIFPAVIKPVDNQGQRGVYFVNSPDELKKEYFRSLSFSKLNLLILEEYIDGCEFSVNGYMLDGKLSYYSLTRRDSYAHSKGGLPLAHLIPYSNEYINSDILNSIISIFKLNNGPVYFQFKINGKDLKLIEIIPRLDGCHLWRLIREFTSIDLLSATFNHLIDNKLPVFNIQLSADSYSLEFFFEKPGTYFNPNGYQIGGSLFYQWYYITGDKVNIVNGSLEKVGYMIKKIIPD